MMNPVTLTMVDGVKVVVPDSLEQITTYALREQQDWFEDEIKFLRRILGPGQRAVDIGANFGVYTLAMARLVGPGGKVWAFEPASATARMLAAGIAANCFDQVSLQQCAVSGARGSAQLHLSANPELNALQPDVSASGETETVPVVSLDDCITDLGWRDLDFVKIDAEGEEANILRGGQRFFASESPLVQYEIKVGQTMDLGLTQSFAAIGYRAYRLVPGLDLLVPFDPSMPVDDYQLNLFCCKPDRAATLAEAGFLVTDPLDPQAFRKRHRDDLLQQRRAVRKYHWRHALASLPYGKALAAHWERTVGTGGSAEVEEALSMHAFSQDRAMPAAQRYAALQASLALLLAQCERQPAYLRLASLARAAREFGARVVAVNALERLAARLLQMREFDPTEPFLAPGPRFDALQPQSGIGAWICAATLEELERSCYFSSYYSGERSRENLENIRARAMGSDEMKRRLELLNLRFGSTR